MTSPQPFLWSRLCVSPKKIEAFVSNILAKLIKNTFLSLKININIKNNLRNNNTFLKQHPLHHDL